MRRRDFATDHRFSVVRGGLLNNLAGLHRRQSSFFPVVGQSSPVSRRMCDRPSCYHPPRCESAAERP
jgi:hypothetical protein